MALYRIGVFGSPSPQQIDDLVDLLQMHSSALGLEWESDVECVITPTAFHPIQAVPTAIAYYGSQSPSNALLRPLLAANIPIIPVVSDVKSTTAELPLELHSLNALSYAQEGVDRVCTALLECLGLLSKQRRVFVSYRRIESSEVALQLFNELSARHFDVFLDTHGIAPGDDFQATLWHRLCDSDVLIMLDTEGYFDRRWTVMEFGRALAKGISILQVVWPSVAPSKRTSTTTRVQLSAADINSKMELTTLKVEEIIKNVEILRSKSHSVRTLNLTSRINHSIVEIGGKVNGVGQYNAIFATLPDGRSITVYPTVGVPTSVSLHDAHTRASGTTTAVVYDEVGLRRDWVEHLDWLSTQVQVARYVKSGEIGWELAGW